MPISLDFNGYQASPFLKWAGGKRWLVDIRPDLFPIEFNRYFEPFLGSGAVYFYLSPTNALLSDTNSELINLYKSIQNQPTLVRRYLAEHHRKHDKTYYYKIRSATCRSPAKRAARTLYLNRTCWNGLYRVNRSGAFNVPIGTKTRVLLPTDDFEALSGFLRGNASFVCRDFEISIDEAESGDYLFVDPPYTVAHNHNGFLKYNEKIFNWEDQVRLKDALVRAHYRGVKFLMTNANHDSVKTLYSLFPQFALNRKSIISGKNSGRGAYDELVVKNY